MSLAYVILLHKRPDQFARLLRAIHDPSNRYVVHVDAKAPPEVHRGVGEVAGRYDNVHVLRSRRILWGGWSIVRAQLDGIEALLRTDDRWTHVINLSGQDYPLRSQREIQGVLAREPGRNFIEIKSMDDRPELRFGRLRYFHVEGPGRVYRLPWRRRVPTGWAPHWGSQWVTLSREFASVAVAGLGDRFGRYLRHSAVPDEFFFQTLAMSGPFRESVVPDNGRFIRWDAGEGGVGLAHHPRTLTARDLPDLLASDCLFARKFDDEVDGNVLDALDERIGSDR